MTKNTPLEQIAAILRHAEAEAYERGRADERRELFLYLTAEAPSLKTTVNKRLEGRPREQSTGSSSPELAGTRKRAPKGTVGKLVRRALSVHPGLTPNEILARAESEFEKMIKPASIRGELRSGLSAGRYQRLRGRWSLVNTNEKAEGQASQLRPSASNHSQGASHETTLD